MENETIESRRHDNNMGHSDEDLLLAQSLPVMYPQGESFPRHTDNRNCLDFLSDGPPPYDEVVEMDAAASSNVGKHKDLYPFKDLRGISNRGLLDGLRVNGKTNKHPAQEALPQVDAGEEVMPEYSASAILTPKLVIEELIKDLEGRTLLKSLSCTLGEDINDLWQLIGSYPLVFAMPQNSDTDASVYVELNPQIDLCEKYFTRRGCRSKCKKIHICIDYLKGHCEDGVCCLYGHDFTTNHNHDILSKFCIEDLEHDSLYNIITKFLKTSFPPTICHRYNERSCNYDLSCFDLHICLNYAKTLGSCPAGDLCILNHNIYDIQCSSVFNDVGILSSNSKEADLLQMVVTNTSRYNASANRSSIQPNMNIIEKDIVDLDISKKDLIDEDSSQESEPSDSDPTSYTTQDMIDKEGNLTSSCILNSSDILEENVTVGGSASGQAEATEDIVWRRKKGYSRRNGLSIQSSSYIEKSNNHDQRHSRQNRREVKNQKKIERMERKVRKIQSKIEYMRSSSVQSGSSGQ